VELSASQEVLSTMEIICHMYIFIYLRRTWLSEVSTVTRLLAGRLKNLGSISGKGKIFSSSRERPHPLWALHTYLYSGYGGCFLGVKQPEREEYHPRLFPV
jgi:hypothetical protein